MTEIQVLHVDDEPDMRLLVQLSLGLDAGISTRSAASGTEALDATAYWRPDLILLDAVMPGMDGLATLHALQANPQTAGIPVLFLTGKCTASDIDGFKARGSAGVIAKPFDPGALATAVRGYVQTTAMGSDEAFSRPLASPDFAGRSSTASGPGGAMPLGASQMVGATTEALLLDGNGNAFALTITDPSVGRSGGPSPAPATEAPMAQLAAPALTVHVTPLDPATLRDILGMNPVGLLTGDDHQAPVADGSPIEGIAFPIGHAVGCTPSSIASSVVDHPAVGLDILHQGTGIIPATDWSAMILPRASMH